MKNFKRTLALMLVLCMVFGLLPVGASALTVSSKPADGTVTGEPFDTSVSANYRIPGLVNFGGTLIATADARWDYEKDGGGMDLVVSRSDDGETWNYTFAGYLGDNGNVWDAYSSTLMDPVIVTDGETLYLLADMFPAGYSISGGNTDNDASNSKSTAYTFSDTATGFDANGNLLLSGDSRSTYGYYLKDGKILTAAGAETGYTVKGWYDLYKDGTYVTNLFFSDSPFQVRATSYICMSTSTDGKTWSDPVLVNAKPEGVSWMVLGPGSGLVTQSGDIAFTAYDNTNIYLIWGKDGAWNTVRTSAAGNESSIVELSDGTIRAFVKRGGSNTIAYVDFAKSGSGYTAGSLVDTKVTNFSNCMVSSLHYSRTLDGKEVVLVCCPSKPGASEWNGRFNGKIHMFTLDDNNAMTLVNSYALNSESDFFAYSNMAEMDDGTLAVLYEDDCISYAAGNHYGDASHITYTTVDLEEAFGVTFDPDSFTVSTDAGSIEVETPASAGVQHIHAAAAAVDSLTGAYTAYDIHLCTKSGDCADCSSCDKAYAGSAVVKLPLPDALKSALAVKPFVITDGAVEYITEFTNDGSYVTFTAPHFSVVGVAEVDVEYAYTDIENVVLFVGDKSETYRNEVGYQPAVNGLNESIATVTMTGVADQAEKLDATVADVNCDELISGNHSSWTETNYYYTPDGTNYYPVYAKRTSSWKLFYTEYTYTWGYSTTNSSGNVTQIGGTQTTRSTDTEPSITVYNVEKTEAVDGYTDITFTAVSVGTTYAVIGDTLYNITVKPDEREIIITEGFSKTVTIEGLQYTMDNVTDQPDGTCVTLVSVTNDGTDTKVTFSGITAGTDTAVIGRVTYFITVMPVNSGNISDFTAIVGEGSYSDGNGSDLNMAGKEITSLRISAGASFDLDVDSTGYDSVTWYSADESVATVDENGVVTAVAAGETRITATVVKDGVSESISISVTVVPSMVEGYDADEISAIFYYIAQVENTTPYYTMFLSTASTTSYAPGHYMVPVTEGEVIWLERPTASAFALIWTAAPDADHALTYMASTGTSGEYFALKDANGSLGESGSGEYYKGSQAYTNIVNVGTDAGASWKTTLDTLLSSSIGTGYGCDGALSSTRWDHDGVPKMVTSMTFISDPMPEIEKTVEGILPITRKRADFRPYADGMMATVGEYVYFRISITVDRPDAWVKDDEGNDTTTGAIEYSNAIVTDNALDGAYFYAAENDTNMDGIISGDEVTTGQTTNINDLLNKAWGAEEQTRTINLYVIYVIDEADILNTTIENVADLKWDYKSVYSTGSLSGSADAEASIYVIGQTLDNAVIDFGQSIIYEGLTDDNLQGVTVDIDNGVAAGKSDVESKYGQVSIAKVPADNTKGYTYSITYTPTAILQAPDTIRIYGTDGSGNRKLINGFVVYPATTVYYEEGFLLNSGSISWDDTNAKSATAVQTFELLNKTGYDSEGKLVYTSGKVHAYGYDPIYANGEVADSSTSATKVSYTSFQFTGEGFELYADCTESSGYISVEIRDANNQSVKVYMVDTAVVAGDTGATTGQTGELNSLPIVSVKDLDHGTYTVILRKLRNDGKTVTLDGVRIINTVADSSVFNIDLEDNPEFYQLRDMVLNAIGVDPEKDSIDYKDMCDQVYNDIDGASAVITDESVTYLNDSTLQDLLDNGPKNELYLWAGQTLTFKVSTARALQIGLKAPAGETSYYLSYEVDGTTTKVAETTMTASEDLFYELDNDIGTEQTYTITVKNTGSSILSVTDLKICDDPTASFVPLEQADVRNILLAAGYVDPNVTDEPAEPEIPAADAVLNIVLVDYTGRRLSAAQLVTSGPANSTAVFTAEQIMAAAKMPKGCDFAEEVTDAKVVCGKTDTVTILAGKVAAVKVTYVNMLGKTVGSATFTKVQTGSGFFSVTAEQIRNAAPEGRTVLWQSGAWAAYGRETNLIVPVL